MHTTEHWATSYPSCTIETASLGQYCPSLWPIAIAILLSAPINLIILQSSCKRNVPYFYFHIPLISFGIVAFTSTHTVSNGNIFLFIKRKRHISHYGSFHSCLEPRQKWQCGREQRRKACQPRQKGGAGSKGRFGQAMSWGPLPTTLPPKIPLRH